MNKTDREAFEEAMSKIGITDFVKSQMPSDPYTFMAMSTLEQNRIYRSGDTERMWLSWQAAKEHYQQESVIKSDDVKEVFAYWQAVMNLQKKRLTPERRAKIKSRLKTYSAQEIKQAIDGCKSTPHNMGVNNRNTPYNDIELICRTDTNLERFRDTQPIHASPEAERLKEKQENKDDVRRKLMDIRDTNW